MALVIIMILISIYVIYDMVRYFISSRLNNKSLKQEFPTQPKMLKKSTSDSEFWMSPLPDITYSRFLVPFGSLGKIKRKTSKSQKKLF